MNELDIGKANVAVAYDLEVIAKVKQKFGKPEDRSTADSFRRLADEGVKGVKLTAEGKREVEERRKANLERRLNARKKRTL